MKSLRFVMLQMLLCSIILGSYNINIKAEDTINMKRYDVKCTDILGYAQNGDLAGIEQCIADGVDINESEKGGYTALQIASKYGQLEIVKYLIEHGAKINQQVELDDIPVVEGVIEYGDTALMYASHSGHLDVVSYLIDMGADVNLKDFKYSTALIRASTDDGHLEVVRFLIDSGADINAKNISNNGVLTLALWSDNFDIGRYLIKSGVDINATDETGNTVLIWAVGKGNLELVKLFIDNGASVNYKNIYTGQIALDVAKKNRQKKVVKYLESLKNVK